MQAAGDINLTCVKDCIQNTLFFFIKLEAMSLNNFTKRVAPVRDVSDIAKYEHQSLIMNSLAN
jgi:hypothetical protein